MSIFHFRTTSTALIYIHGVAGVVGIAAEKITEKLSQVSGVRPRLRNLACACVFLAIIIEEH